MYQVNNHVILSHIDAPARIFIWEAKQAMICAVPIAFGMLTGELGIGLCLSFVVTILLKIFKNRFEGIKVRSMLYWYLPTPTRLIKMGVPESHVRFWIK